MKTLTIEDVKVEILVEQDDISVRGNAIHSGNPAFDKTVEDGIIERLDNGDTWAWAQVEVKAKYMGLEASYYLGCCSYKDEAEFKEDGYYTDMVNDVLADLNQQVAKIVDSVQ